MEALFAAVLVLCTGCARQLPPVAAVRPAPVDPRTQMAALERRIFDLVQDERRAINPKARPLALDSELMGVARRRSADMARNHYIAHSSPQGVTSASLVMDEDKDFQGLLGENLAADNFVPQSGVDVDAYAKAFVQTWLASPAHKENLSFAAYDRSAVGATVGGDTIFVVQLFATDLGLPPHDPRKQAPGEIKEPVPQSSAR
jgi:uncharacterized protein YkwD